MIELLACWRGQLESHTILEAWKTIALCLMWCTWRQQNARCFEDHETSVEELKNIIFKSLRIGIGVYNSSHFPNFSEFLNFSSSFHLNRGFLLYTSCAVGLCSSVLLMKLTYLSKRRARDEKSTENIQKLR